MTADANPPSPTARGSSRRLLVAVLLAAFSLGGGLFGGDLAVAVPTGGASLAATSTSEEVPVNGAAGTAIASRSIRRGIRRYFVTRRAVAGDRLLWTWGSLAQRRAHPTTPMWRGPPALRL